jgi:hypothetical protein
MKNSLKMPIRLVLMLALLTSFASAQQVTAKIDKVSVVDNYILISDVEMKLFRFTIVQYEGDIDEMRRPLTSLITGQWVKVEFSKEKGELARVEKITILPKQPEKSPGSGMFN